MVMKRFEGKPAERPMLFSAPMVRAILDGRKTQTRRIVKGAPMGDFWQPAFVRGELLFDAQLNPPSCTKKAIRCPYSKPGDRLWVRETWAPDGEMGGLWFRAGVPVYVAGQHSGDWDTYDRLQGNPPPDELKWKPSIFMPRWASRLLLEIVSVRVERLANISEEDAVAEGISPQYAEEGTKARYRYWQLWEQINGKGSWAKNPWVWVVEFKRVEVAA